MMTSNVVLALGISLFLFSSSLSQAASKPNIIFILLDDAGWNDFGYTGNEFVETPNIDKLASESTRYLQAYASHSFCSPTRQSLISGMYPARTAWTKKGEAKPRTYRHPEIAYSPAVAMKWTSLPTDYKSIANILNEAGYHTGHIGKWHYGLPQQDITPESVGFDFNFAGKAHVGAVKDFFYPYPGLGSEIEGAQGEYLTDRLNQEAVEFIERNHAGPFFLQLWHFAVHTPIQGKHYLVEKYREKRRAMGHMNSNPAYAAMMESVDDGIAMIRDTLLRLGIAETTYIVLASDNGAQASYGSVPITSVAPYRGLKETLTEGGIRIPMFIYQPGEASYSQDNHTPVTVLDLFPTFIDWAEAPAPQNQKIDGQSLRGTLGSATTDFLSDRPLYWYDPKSAILSSRHIITPTIAIRKGHYKWLHPIGAPGEIYNLHDDPGETDDLARREPERAAEFQKLEDDWFDEVGIEKPRQNSAYDSNAFYPRQVESPYLDAYVLFESWEETNLKSWRAMNAAQISTESNGLKIASRGTYPQVRVQAKTIPAGHYLAEMTYTAKTTGRFRLHWQPKRSQERVFEIFPEKTGRRETTFIEFASDTPVQSISIAGPTHLSESGHYDPALHDDFYFVHGFKLWIRGARNAVNPRESETSR